MPEKRYTDAEIRMYFERIGWHGTEEVSLKNLEGMLKHHLYHIPYENLDLLNEVPLSLKPGDLFHKIVREHRGGYCFELQGVFYYLLLSLGYDVTQYAGRFMDEPWHIQMRRHRILVVTLKGRRYVVDVGVRSESPRIPLELTEGKLQFDGISIYRYRKDPFFGWVLMQKEEGKEWKDLLGFTEEIQTDDDFVMPSFYCEKHPDSTFNKFMKVSIFTPESDLTIVGNTFKDYRHARAEEKQKLHSNEEAREILEKVFGIQVSSGYRHFLYDAGQELKG